MGPGKIGTGDDLFMNRVVLSLFNLVLISNFAFSLDVVTPWDGSACQDYHFSKKVIAYKDPSLFIGSLGLVLDDPQRGWENLMSENPVLTVLEGTVSLIKLGSPFEFKDFGLISRFYELVEPRLKLKVTPKKYLKDKMNESERPLVVAVRVCNSSPIDALGFVLLSDFNMALRQEPGLGGLPPSIYPNPVPNLNP